MKASKKNENIYTLLPRFVEETSSQSYIDGKYLSSITREFKWNNIEFTLIITPARVCEKNGEDRYYYPTLKRESLIEDTLRKLAIEENTNFIATDSTLYFSLSQIKNELKLRQYEIKLGIAILADTKFELISSESELYFRPIEKLKVLEKNGELYYCAQFSELFFNRTREFDFCFL